MKTAFITGGAGFLGSHMCDLLLDKGFKVICMDNFITGNERNIAHLKDNKNFVFIRQDCTKHIKIEEPVDYVLHFASPASPIDYQQIPIQTLKAGAIGTWNCLGLAKEKKAVFFLASTSEVYGDPLIHPQKEDYWGNVNPVGPRSCYDEAKRFAEALAVAYKMAHNVHIRIARIFNTYGPRMRAQDGRVVPAFITQALQGKPLTVFGDGKQTRSFCYVKDEVEGLYKLMMSDVEEPVNIGNPNEMTVVEFANTVQKVTKSKSKIIFKPLPKDDPRVRQPDITKAKKLLGWQPKTSLEKGLKETMGYFMGNA